MSFIGKKRKKTNIKSNSETSFLVKLYTILNEKKYSEYISWSKDGLSFIIPNQNNFMKKVIPNVYNLHKFSSFVRQLNMYNFHKIKTLKKGELKYKHNEFNKFKSIEEIKEIKKNSTLDKNNDNDDQVKNILTPKTEDNKDFNNQLISKNINIFGQEIKLKDKLSNESIINHLLDKTKENIDYQKNVEKNIKDLIKQNNNLMEKIKSDNNKIISQKKNSDLMKGMINFLLTLINIKDNKIYKEKLKKLFCKYLDYRKIKFNNNNNKKGTIIQKAENIFINQDIFEDLNIHHNLNEADFLTTSFNRNMEFDSKYLNLRPSYGSSLFFGDNNSLRQSRINFNFNK